MELAAPTSPLYAAAPAFSPRQAHGSGGSGSNNTAPNVLEQREDAQRAADDNSDACMSNDESMSSSSSLDIDDVVNAIGEFECESMDARIREQQEQRAQQTALLQRSASFSDAYQQHLRQQHGGGGSPTHPWSYSFDFLPPLASAHSDASATDRSQHSNRSDNDGNNDDDSRGVWLFTQFAPAMSKTVRSSSSHDGSSDGSAPWRQPWASRCTAPIDRTDGVHVVAAQNEVTGIQVRLRSSCAFQVVTDASNWFSAHGHAPRARVAIDTSFVPPQLQVEVFVVGYVTDERGDATMETLDAGGVSPATTLASSHAVYVRLRVGSSVHPGAYELPVRVFTQHAGLTDEQLSWRSCVHVRVAAVALPPPRAWRFHLDLWQHHSSIARAHGVALWSDRHFELIERYLRPLAEVGQKCISVVATEIPWIGQQCYLETAYPSALYEHALLPVYDSGSASGSGESTLEVDFQHFDRLLSLASTLHMDAEIEVFGLLCVWRDAANGFDGPAAMPAERRRRRRSTSSTSPTTGTTTAAEASDLGEANVRERGDNKDDTSDAQHHSQSAHESKRLAAWRIRCTDRTTGAIRYLRCLADVERFVRLFYDHCVALGVVDRVRVCADEPTDLAHFHDQTQWLERLAPGFQIKLALNSLAFLTYAPPQVVDYVPLLPLVCADLDVTRRLKTQVRERGGKLCWYVCCSPAFPNQFVSSPLVEGELVGYLTFFLELDGFLRWNYCLWPAAPWSSLQWRSPSWRVGDMYFVLPGADGAPVETLRFESLRFAVQTHELLLLAQDVLSPIALEQLKSEVAQLIWRTTDFAQFVSCDNKSPSDLYSLDPLDYQRAKVLLLDTIATAQLASGGRGGTSPLPSPGFDDRIGPK